jgi:hypothetical protein
MRFASPIASFLTAVALAGCGNGDVNQGSTISPSPAEHPNVDSSFLSALEWRFVGPYRGGRVVAVAGHPGDPHLY